MTWVAENIVTLWLMVVVLLWFVMYQITRRELERTHRAFSELMKDYADAVEGLEVRRKQVEVLNAEVEKRHKLLDAVLREAAREEKRGDN